MFPDAREVRLGPDERAELEARLRAPTSEQRHVFRARIVLMAAEGLSTRAIARDLGTMPRTASHWRIRFAEEGLSGLDDRPRPGGRASAKYDETTDRRILAVLGRPPPEGYARWTGGLVAEALGDVSDQYVWRATGEVRAGHYRRRRRVEFLDFEQDRRRSPRSRHSRRARQPQHPQ